MSAITHSLKQGSDEWLDFRKHHFGASEAAAMLGISPYISRDELLRQKVTGITPEVDAATQRLFDDGHKIEAKALPIAEEIIKEQLFQPTMSLVVDGIPLSCSCDGLTLMQDVVWECKTLNNALRESLPGSIPESYHPQLEQMMLITGAEKALFMACDGETELHCWYAPNLKLRKKIIAGWKQFQKDMEDYKVPDVVEEVTPNSIESLPAIAVNVTGSLAVKSNLDQFEKQAMTFIGNINTELSTDQEFADAEAMVKFCSKTEKELDAVKQNVLGQVSDIDAALSMIDRVKGEMRTRRLSLDKQVKAQKQAVRDNIVMTAKQALADHLKSLDARLHDSVRMPDVAADFAGAIKGKRTIESLRGAANDELARAKIEASEIADHIESNVKKLMKISDGKYGFLFADIQQIITKPEDDLIALAKMRIADHEKAEAERIEAERERMRVEEVRKAAARVEPEKPASVESTQPEKAKVVSMPSKPAAQTGIMEELAAWCDAWKLSLDASAELCEIVERYLPEKTSRKA